MTQEASTAGHSGNAPIAFGESLAAAGARLSASRWLAWLPLPTVTLLSFFLNAWNIGRDTYGNTYYAAAARSMTMSWKNFFFGAFDPGGFITVDKPPAFLWVGALSARIFEYSPWSIILPSAVAGAAAVAVLWLIARRYFGVTAATISALVLALTPISVAVNRLNLPEPFLILALIGAAGATLRSLESRRWWAWTALAGLLIGVAFNTKMLAGWIPGPALPMALVVGSRALWLRDLRQLGGRLLILAVSTFAFSASWMLVVDHWPPSGRPYIGGSSDNTVQDLVLGYNGFGRVEGEAQGFRGGGPAPNPPPGPNQPQGQGNAPRVLGGNPPTTAAAVTPGVDGFNRPAQVGPPGTGGPGGIIAGAPRLWRMFDAANGGQIAWFLPFALLSSVVSLWWWRKDLLRRALIVLFVGWVILFAGVFSYAQGIYHSYYTSAMAPGVAVLVGVGTVGMSRAIGSNRLWVLAAAIVIGATIWVQLTVTGRSPGFYDWIRPLMVWTAVAGVVAAAALALRRWPVTPALMMSVVGLVALPAAWAMNEVESMSLNTTLPQAGPRGGAAGRSFSSEAFDDGTASLAGWLKIHAGSDAHWQLVTAGAQNGSTLIAEYGISVMALGGFSGRDQTITVAEFAELVADGDVRYVLTGEARGFRGGGIGGLAPGGAFGAGTAPGTTRPQGGVPLQGGSPSVTSPRGGFGAPPGPTTGNSGLGASGPGSAQQAIFSAVSSASTVVDDPGLSSTYRGSLYDCQGAEGAFGRIGNG